MGFKERQHFIIKHVRRHQSVLAIVEFGQSDLGVSVDEGLLIDATDTFQSADVESVLRAEITRMLRFYFTVCFLLLFGSFECPQLLLS